MADHFLGWRTADAALCALAPGAEHAVTVRLHTRPGAACAAPRGRMGPIKGPIIAEADSAGASRLVEHRVPVSQQDGDKTRMGWVWTLSIRKR